MCWSIYCLVDFVMTLLTWRNARRKAATTKGEVMYFYLKSPAIITVVVYNQVQ
jgi:hypothetical protein